MVVSRQASERKSEFVKQLLVHVVLPNPAEFRPILRRLTAISAGQILKQAQYLLEQSLLADLKAVVARCLSGLDLFNSGDLRRASLTGRVSTTGTVSRKATQTEGLYKGLGSMTLPQTTKAHVEAQTMAMLVEAPAAVDDALALLLALPDTEILEDQESSLHQVATLGIEYRALLTYIKRIYHHQITGSPKIMTHGSFAVALWTYQDAFGVECHGAMVVIKSLAHLKEGLTHVTRLLTHLQTAMGTFHVALTGDESEAFKLFSEAETLFKGGAVCEDRDLFDQDDRVCDSLTDMDPQEAAQRIQACVDALAPDLKSHSFETISLMIQTSKQPLRKGYVWNAIRQCYLPQITLR